MNTTIAAVTQRTILDAVVRLVLVLSAFALFAGPVDAQVSSVTFKNFHRYPATGLWSQQVSGTRNGVSMGPPQTSKTCAGAADPKMIVDMQKIGDAKALSCKTSVITDTDRVAEYERTCVVGGAPRVMHSTMKYVDDKNYTLDSRDTSPGFMETVTHVNVTYLGPCTAAEAKPTAAECAQMASDMKDFAGADAQCAQAPPAYRAQCMAQIASSTKMMETMKARCQ